MNNEPTPTRFGREILRFRKTTGLSLREVSRRAELAPASLSAVERGISSPTLATLERILKAMGTDLAEFFASCPETPEAPVFRASDMKPVRDTQREYTLLFPKREDIKFEIVRESIVPNGPESEWETHDFDLGGTVVEGGPMQLEIEGMGSWKLSDGDAFYVSAGRKHHATNIGATPLKLITIACPPKY